jgi:hypothetical protein
LLQGENAEAVILLSVSLQNRINPKIFGCGFRLTLVNVSWRHKIANHVIAENFKGEWKMHGKPGKNGPCQLSHSARHQKQCRPRARDLQLIVDNDGKAF